MPYCIYTVYSVLLVEPEEFNTSSTLTKFSNSVDPDEAAHDEPPHLDLHCLPAGL